MGCGQSSAGIDRRSPEASGGSPTKSSREPKRAKVAYEDIVLGTIADREAVLTALDAAESPPAPEPEHEQASSPLCRKASETQPKAHERASKERQQRDRTKSVACIHGNRSSFIPAPWLGSNAENGAHSLELSNSQVTTGQTPSLLSRSGNPSGNPGGASQQGPSSPTDQSYHVVGVLSESAAFPPTDGCTNRSSISRGETQSNIRSIRAAAERLDEQSAVPSTIQTENSGSLRTESAAVSGNWRVGSPKNMGKGMFEQAVNSRRQSLAVAAPEPAPAEVLARIREVVSKAATSYGITPDPDQFADTVALETKIHISSLTERKMRYIVAAIDSFLVATLTGLSASPVQEAEQPTSGAVPDGTANIRVGHHTLQLSFGALPCPLPPDVEAPTGAESPFALHMEAPADCTLRGASGMTSPRRLSTHSQNHSQHVDEIDSWLVGGA